MPEFIGNVPVPEITPSGTFPIVPDYGYGRAQQPEVIVHQFGSANAKIEQRFLLGTGAKRFTVRRGALNDADRVALRDFFETHFGPFGAFTYNAPHDDGNGTTPFTCRFANEPLSWEMLTDWVSAVGVTLIEIPASFPVYSLNSTLTRFPSAALTAALLNQVQQLVPLVKIEPRQPGYPAIFVSDRRVAVGGQLYQARLLDFDGISQSLGNEADEARFRFGNADRVMRELANDVDLFRASLEFSLFHVALGIKLELWKGEIVDWQFDAGPEFQVTAADGLYELNLPYPTRRISRSCWKDFNDGLSCPFATQSTGMDFGHFPGADASKCDKGYETPNGCLAHGMKRHFGGLIVEPQGVRIRDNSTGTWGFGRSSLTSVSLVAESIYDEVIPEIYTDSPMLVNAKIAAGRDESDFYAALGIVGEGPLGAFGSGHKLDNQLHHGSPGALGLRTVLGTDPAGAEDFFALGQSGNQVGTDWRKVFAGASTYKDNFAAAVAFLELRRSDAKGLQLSRPGEHQMQAMVASGMSGWVWTAPGARSAQTLTNPIWIAVNMMLRARGLRFASAADAEKFFDVEAAMAAAAVCDLSVTRLVGTGTETQFKFRGVLQEEKPLRDWVQEVLMNALGHYTFSFGKLKLGVRANSSAVEAFTEGNILFQSLQLAPLKPSFNHLTANFADEEFDYVTNSITLYDIEHAKLIGGATSPLFLKSNVNLSGSSSKSQAARIIAVRLREELGGVSTAEWKAARMLTFKTTILALALEVGMICSLTHPDMPGGLGEFRVTGWRLNKDFSIEIQGRTSTDSMYDLVAGPKPADVLAEPVPVEPARDWAVPPAPVMTFTEANFPRDGSIALPKITFPGVDNYQGVSSIMVVVYFVDELNPKNTTLAAAITAGDLAIPLANAARADLQPGDVAVISSKSDAPGRKGEAILIDSVNGNTVNVLAGGRGWHGTVAGAHAFGMRVDKLSGKILHFPFKPGFFVGPEKNIWHERIILPSVRCTSIHAAATNAFGQGPLGIFNLLEFDSDPGELNTQDGQRTNSGGALILQWEGELQAVTDVGPPVIVPLLTSPRDYFATLDEAAAGGIITIVLKKNGLSWAVFFISAGGLISQRVAGSAPSVTDLLDAGDRLTFDIILGAGVTFAGKNLTIIIRT